MPQSIITRLCLCRRHLEECQANHVQYVRSQDLAEMIGSTAAQVRRDLMQVGADGSPNRGYLVKNLKERITAFLRADGENRLALIGVGNLGRALLVFFTNRYPHLRITAAFEVDPEKTGRVIHGCRCHPLSDLAPVLSEQGIFLAIIAVPATQAQAVADRLVAAGVRSLINFAPVRLKVPAQVQVDNVDLTMAIERAVYYSRAQDPLDKDAPQ